MGGLQKGLAVSRINVSRLPLAAVRIDQHKQSLLHLAVGICSFQQSLSRSDRHVYVFLNAQDPRVQLKLIFSVGTYKRHLNSAILLILRP
jgi:hypothetical protein